jgi:hypothetical protein
VLTQLIEIKSPIFVQILHADENPQKKKAVGYLASTAA